MMKIDEDIQFLKMQREKGRQGSMTGTDVVLAQKEKRKLERATREEERKTKQMKQNAEQSNILNSVSPSH